MPSGKPKAGKRAPAKTKRPRSIEKVMDHFVGRKDDPLFRRYQVGKTTQLSLFEFLFALFEKNELLPANKRLTNEGLREALIFEFPNKKEDFLSGRYDVNYYRDLYNRGRTTPGGAMPKHVSFRYNAQGIAVDSRTGKQILTPEQKIEWVRKWQGRCAARRMRLQNRGKHVSDDQQ